MSERPSSRIAQRRAAALESKSPDYVAKRKELVRVAADVFREKGLAAANLNDIAERFGTDRASLYYYVGSKEELFQECITETVVLNLERAEEIAAKELRPSEHLRALIEVLINSQVEHYPYMYVYMQEDMLKTTSTESEWTATMVEKTHAMERHFLNAISAGVADGSFRKDLSPVLIANSIFGMTQWTHRWWVPVGGASRHAAADLIKTFSTVLLEGIEVVAS